MLGLSRQQALVSAQRWVPLRTAGGLQGNAQAAPPTLPSQAPGARGTDLGVSRRLWEGGGFQREAKVEIPAHLCGTSGARTCRTCRGPVCTQAVEPGCLQAAGGGGRSPESGASVNTRAILALKRQPFPGGALPT